MSQPNNLHLIQLESATGRIFLRFIWFQESIIPRCLQASQVVPSLCQLILYIDVRVTFVLKRREEEWGEDLIFFYFKPFNPIVPLRTKRWSAVLQNEKVLELCFTMSIHLTLLNLTLKNGYCGKCHVTRFSPQGRKQKETNN